MLFYKMRYSQLMALLKLVSLDQQKKIPDGLAILLDLAIDALSDSPFFKPINCTGCKNSVSQAFAQAGSCATCREQMPNDGKNNNAPLDQLACEIIVPFIEKELPDEVTHLYHDTNQHKNVAYTATNAKDILKQWNKVLPTLSAAAQSFIGAARPQSALAYLKEKTTAIKTEVESTLNVKKTALAPHIYELEQLVATCLEKDPRYYFALATSDWYSGAALMLSNKKEAIAPFEKALSHCYHGLILLSIYQVQEKTTKMDATLYPIIDKAISTHIKLTSTPVKNKFYHFVKASLLCNLKLKLLSRANGSLSEKDKGYTRDQLNMVLNLCETELKKAVPPFEITPATCLNDTIQQLLDQYPDQIDQSSIFKNIKETFYVSS